MHSSLFADLTYDAQRTIAANAELHRQTQEANLAHGRTGFRQRMGNALISLGTHVGGINRDAITTITADAIRTHHDPTTTATGRAC